MFRRRRRLFVFPFFFQRDSSGSNRAHPHTHLFCCFLFCFCVPPRLFLPVLAVHPASWRSGCHSGPRAFLGFSLDLLRPFSWDARRQGFSALLLPCFSFSPFRCVLLLFFSHALEGADPSSNEAYPRVIEPAPRPSEGPGSAIVRGRLDTGFRDTFFALTCLAEGHRDPLGLLSLGRGRFLCSLRPFFTRTCVCFPAPGFFLVAFEAKLVRRIAWTLSIRSEYGISNSDSCPENTPKISEKSR